MLTTTVIQATTAVTQVTTTAQAEQGLLNTVLNWSIWEQLDAILGVLSIVVGFIVWIYRLPYFRLIRECSNYIASDDYSSYISALKRHYIHTRGQDTDPCNSDNPADDNGKDLINYFIKEVFTPSCKGKVFIIYADSGMGKTTFLLKLYQKYANKLFIRDRRWIYHVSLSGENGLERIKEKNAEKHSHSAILLLDALDEQTCEKDAGMFLDKVLTASENFYRIIITCRTQYFENEQKEKFPTHYISRSINGKNVQLVKKYLSPFSDKEVACYLRKKFPLNIKKRKQAKKIVEKIPDLFIRPMILYWIDILCDDTEQDYEFTCQIYEKIVNKWLERDASELVRDIDGEPIQDIEKAKEMLFDFCLEITRYFVKNNKNRISTEEIKRISTAIDLDELTARSRTLLNRNSLGEYKFSHKSFFDYFCSYLWHKETDDSILFPLLQSTEAIRKFVGEESVIKVRRYVRGEEKILSKRLACLDFRNLTLNEFSAIKSELKGADLSFADFHSSFLLVPYRSAAISYRADFRELDLSGAYLVGANLTRATLTGANFSGAYLVGANLTGATLVGADLTGANFAGANIVDAKFCGADLTGTQMYKIHYNQYTDFTVVKFDLPLEEILPLEEMKTKWEWIYHED